MADIFRAPVISPRKDGPARAAIFDPPNILIGLLAVLPFHATDFPAAKPIAQVHREYDAPNLILSTLQPVVVVAPPFIPNIPLSPAGPLAKAASYDPPNLPLAVLVPTRPFQAFVWANPYAMPPRAAAFDPPFPNPPPPAPPPDVTPQGGHWLAPTKAELDRIRREAAEARARQEAEWAQAIKDRETLHEQVMASLHPEKVLGVPLPEAATVTTDDDEEDIEILLLNG